MRNQTPSNTQDIFTDNGDASTEPARAAASPVELQTDTSDEAHRRSTASSIARITLIGNVGVEPETRTTPDGRLICRFRVAVNFRRKDPEGRWHEHTDWYSVTAFGPLAALALDRLSKGLRVYVHGRLEARYWQGPEGARCFLDIVASDLVPLDRLARPPADSDDHLPDTDVGDLPF